MKYLKAEDIFPKELLREVQKYVHGETVYIPNPEGLRKKWGENSGSRQFLNQRNHEIRKKFSEGVTIAQLTDQFVFPLTVSKKLFTLKSNFSRLAGLICEPVLCIIRLSIVFYLF